MSFDIKSFDIKLDKKLIIDISLLLVSFISFILFYSAIKWEILSIFDWLLSLDWYWYLIIMILTAIRPAYTIYTMIKKNK